MLILLGCDCGVCRAKIAKAFDQLDRIRGLLPGLEENKSTASVARAIRAIMELPTQREEARGHRE